MLDQLTENPTLETENQTLPRISVFGLGKLGSPMAAVFAAAGFSVCGYDLNKSYVEKISHGEAPITETGLPELLAQAKERLTATESAEIAVMTTDVTFVIVPTPCDPTGEFSNDYVLSAVDTIGQAIKKKAKPHLVVITSTVMPGSTDNVIAKCLEKASGYHIGGGKLGLCYSPEFIALGSVINDMRNPDFILIGESDADSGSKLQSIYEASCAYPPICYRMNFVNAELTKISVNTFVTTKISYANMLADLCTRLPGADVDVVTDAVGADTRIGKKYLKGAVSYGGPCFPRDNRAFSALGNRIGADCSLAKITDELNAKQVERLIEAIHLAAPKAQNIAVLGLSYKPNTHVIEQSAGVDLAQALKARGFNVAAFDPQACDEAKKLESMAGSIVRSCEEALRCSEVAIITTPWQEFINLGNYNEVVGLRAIIDPWRIIEAKNIPPQVNLLSLGRST